MSRRQPLTKQLRIARELAARLEEDGYVRPDDRAVSWWNERIRKLAHWQTRSTGQEIGPDGQVLDEVWCLGWALEATKWFRTAHLSADEIALTLEQGRAVTEERWKAEAASAALDDMDYQPL